MYDIYVMTELGFSGNHFSKRTISQAPVTALQSGPLEEVAVTLPLNHKGRWQAGVADPQANTYPPTSTECHDLLVPQTFPWASNSLSCSGLGVECRKAFPCSHLSVQAWPFRSDCSMAAD